MGLVNFNYKELKAYTGRYLFSIQDQIKTFTANLLDYGQFNVKSKPDRIKLELVTIGNTLFSIASYN